MVGEFGLAEGIDYKVWMHAVARSVLPRRVRWVVECNESEIRWG